MASNVINDSTSVHEYRGKIQHVTDELKLQIGKTERAIEAANEEWKDGNFTEFQQNFAEDKEKIKPLCDVLYNYENTLLYQLEEKLKVLESRRFKC